MSWVANLAHNILVVKVVLLSKIHFFLSLSFLKLELIFFKTSILTHVWFVQCVSWCSWLTVGKHMYQLKVDVDKLNAVKVVVNWRFER